MRGHLLRGVAELCDYMQELGWKPYQNDHEDGNGQYEMNWEYDDCLITADRHTFFKFMAKSVAEKHGMRASFMPKPFANRTGSGAHCHVSVWDPTSNLNLFEDDKGELVGISRQELPFFCCCFATEPGVPWCNVYKHRHLKVNLDVWICSIIAPPPTSCDLCVIQSYRVSQTFVSRPLAPYD